MPRAHLLHAPLGVIVAGCGDPWGDFPATALPCPCWGWAGAAIRATAATTRSMPGRQTVQVSFDDDPRGAEQPERLIRRLDEVELPRFHPSP